MNSAVVGRVFTLGQAAVLLHTGFRDKLGVLVGDAIPAFVVGLGIVGGPPVTQIAFLIELAPLVVVAVDGLVANHSAGGGIVDRVVLGRIEKRRLQNSRREVDGVGLRVFIRVHSWRRHSPVGSVDLLANFAKLTVEFKRRGTLHVFQVIVRMNI